MSFVVDVLGLLHRGLTPRPLGRLFADRGVADGGVVSVARDVLVAVLLWVVLVGRLAGLSLVVVLVRHLGLRALASLVQGLDPDLVLGGALLVTILKE